MRWVLAVVGAIALVGVQSMPGGLDAQAAERGTARRPPAAAGTGAVAGLPRVDGLTFTGCSPGQVTTLKDAIGRAAVALDQSIGELRSGAAARDLGTWFGRADPHRVAAVLQGIRDRLQSAAPLRVECSSPVDCTDSEFAYSQSGGTVVGFCNAFFAMPEEGFDTRFGTIVHEFSHLTARTEDHAYGVEDAQALAARSPREAADNADNYEYFVESGQGASPGRVAGRNRGDRGPAGDPACKWGTDAGGKCVGQPLGSRR